MLKETLLMLVQKLAEAPVQLKVQSRRKDLPQALLRNQQQEGKEPVQKKKIGKKKIWKKHFFLLLFSRLDDPDSGYKSPPKYDKDDIVKRMEDDDDEKIEEMIDDISTNEMFGSSILSMEN